MVIQCYYRIAISIVIIIAACRTARVRFVLEACQQTFNGIRAGEPPYQSVDTLNNVAVVDNAYTHNEGVCPLHPGRVPAQLMWSLYLIRQRVCIQSVYTNTYACVFGLCGVFSSWNLWVQSNWRRLLYRLSDILHHGRSVTISRNRCHKTQYTITIKPTKYILYSTLKTHVQYGVSVWSAGTCRHSICMLFDQCIHLHINSDVSHAVLPYNVKIRLQISLRPYLLL